MNEGLIVLIIFLGLASLRVPIPFALLAAGLVFWPSEPSLSTTLMASQLFNSLNSFILLAVPFFIFAGMIMNEAQVTERLLRLARATVGWVTGGLAMVNVAASMMFAGVSGSAVADTAAVGGTLMPEMRKRGYADDFTVAVTAASSVIGAIIPPSILLVLWGSLTQTSIGALFIAGIIPGVLIGLGLLTLCYVFAKKYDYPREPRVPMKDVISAGRDAALALGVPIVIIGGIFTGLVTATEAAVLGVAYSLFLGVVVYRTIKVKDIWRILTQSSKLTALPMFALAGASMLGFLLSYFRVPLLFDGAFSGIPLAFLLLAIAGMWLFLGTFLDSTPAMVIMIPLLAPVVATADLNPIHYGIVSVVALSVGLVTPPYGICLLMASSMHKVPIAKVIPPLLCFIGVIVAVLILIIYVPGIVTWTSDL